MVLTDGTESRFLQSLDSLWFFTNIFSCSTKTQNQMVLVGARIDENDEEQTFVEKDGGFSAKESKPISPTIEIEQNGALVCEKCGEEEESSLSAEKMVGRSRRRRRSKRGSGCGQRREVFGELKLGCFGDEVEMYLSPRNVLNVNGGVAMKEHLKSWACAVASTVK